MLARLVERADVLMENYRVGVLDRLGFPVSRLHELNPGLVVLSITGFGHDGPEAKPRRLRPDRPGRGRSDVDHGHRAADQGRRPDRGPDRGHERRLRGAWPRCTSGPAPAAAGSCVRRCWPAWSACTPSRAPGGRWPARCPGLSGDHHPSIAPYGMFATATRADPDRLRLRGTVARAVRRRRVGRRPRTGSPPTPSGSPTATTLIERLESHFADQPAEHWLELLDEAGVPSGKVRSMDDVYSWEQTLSQGLLLPVEHPTLGEVDLPGSAHPPRRPAPLRRPVRRTSPRRRSASTTSRSGSGWTR